MSATNISSKFSPFSLPLPNNATLTGIAYIPPPSTWTTSSPRPLVVALHGGTCTAHNYDVSPKYTSSNISAKTGIPIVSIDRPCYAGTSSFLPFPEDEAEHSFFKETARWLHEYILPKLWSEHAIPNNCAGIVLLSHSMAVPPSVITAALYSSSPSNEYTLSGIVLSGFGAPGAENSQPGELPDTKEILFPAQIKQLIMLSEPEFNCADPELLPLVDAQTAALPIEEMRDYRTMWASYSAEYAPCVEIPILYGMGEHDWLWKSDEDSMKAFRAPFKKCKRFDSEMIAGSPHALEWGWRADEWYEMVFRFANEVCGEGDCTRL